MPFFKASIQLIQMIFTTLWRLMGSVLEFLFGSLNYQAPSWMKWCGRKVALLVSLVKQKPAKSLGIVALLAALATGGWQAWAWYQAPRHAAAW